MSDQITTFILSHTNELCATVIPSMENSLVKDVTSAIEIQDYTITITISKQKVLGKRRYETPISSRSIIPKFDTSSDHLLYNNLGHNF